MSLGNLLISLATLIWISSTSDHRTNPMSHTGLIYTAGIKLNDINFKRIPLTVSKVESLMPFSHQEVAFFGLSQKIIIINSYH